MDAAPKIWQDYFNMQILYSPCFCTSIHFGNDGNNWLSYSLINRSCHIHLCRSINVYRSRLGIKIAVDLVSHPGQIFLPWQGRVTESHGICPYQVGTIWHGGHVVWPECWMLAGKWCFPYGQTTPDFVTHPYVTIHIALPKQELLN